MKATRPTVGGDITEADADAMQAEEQKFIDTGKLYFDSQFENFKLTVQHS
jgi:hypothetical protein